MPDLVPGTWVAGGSKPLWKSLSFRLALLLAVGSGGLWLYQRMQPASEGLLQTTAPAVARFGLCFMAAAAIGFVLRKVIKATLWIAATIGILIALAKWTGLIHLDWLAIERSTAAAMQETRDFAQRTADVALGYLPSGAASMLGLWRGSKRDSVV
jgi:uncharacterized membrane protein (Fun14 family)